MVEIEDWQWDSKQLDRNVRCDNRSLSRKLELSLAGSKEGGDPLFPPRPESGPQSPAPAKPDWVVRGLIDRPSLERALPKWAQGRAAGQLTSTYLTYIMCE